MIIGTAGHIDHGKTALVRALTGVDTDRLAEEKARGISIDLGFAYLPTPDGGVLGFVDVPGHERFIRNMLAGATGIDFVLLVVAADDGVMPQTREHLAIVDLLGLTHGVVALTKSDLADAPRRAEVIDEITRRSRGTALAGAAIVPVSTVTGEGIEALRKHLIAAADMRNAGPAPAALPPRGRSRLHVDRRRHGRDRHRAVGHRSAVGDRVVVSPSGLAARVRSIHAQNRPAEHGRAGDRCALNLAGDGVGKHAIARGDVVIDPGPARADPADRRDVARACHRAGGDLAMDAGAAAPRRRRGRRPRRAARRATSRPAPRRRVQLVLERPIAAACGDRFVLRDTSAQRTIGGGRFLDLRAPQRRRRTAERHAQLDALAHREPEAALAALLACAPYHVDLSTFARDHALASAELEEASKRSRRHAGGDARRRGGAGAGGLGTAQAVDRGDARHVPRRQSRPAGIEPGSAAPRSPAHACRSRPSPRRPAVGA